MCIGQIGIMKQEIRVSSTSYQTKALSDSEKGRSCHPDLLDHSKFWKKLDLSPIALHCHPTCIKFIMFFMYQYYDITQQINLITFNGMNCRYWTREPFRSNHYVYENVRFDSSGIVWQTKLRSSGTSIALDRLLEKIQKSYVKNTPTFVNFYKL